MTITYDICNFDISSFDNSSITISWDRFYDINDLTNPSFGGETDQTLSGSITIDVIDFDLAKNIRSQEIYNSDNYDDRINIYTIDNLSSGVLYLVNIASFFISNEQNYSVYSSKSIHVSGIYNDQDQDGSNNDVDEFPTNPYQWIDTDNDGFGDNSFGLSGIDLYNICGDAFPTLLDQWLDTDNDHYGDNRYGISADYFPNDPNRHTQIYPPIEISLGNYPAYEIGALGDTILFDTTTSNISDIEIVLYDWTGKSLKHMDDRDPNITFSISSDGTFFDFSVNENYTLPSFNYTFLDQVIIIW